MKTKWISLRSIKQHEFRTTLRYIKASGATWHDIYIKLGALQDRAVANLIKSSSAIAIYYLLLSSLGSEERVGITIQGVTASLPTSFLTAVASVGLFIIVMQLQTVVMIMSLRSHEGTRLSLRGFSMGAYGLYNDQDELELSVPILRYGSFREVLPTSRLLGLMMTIVISSLLVPLVALWVYLFDLQLGIATSDSIDLALKVAAAFGNLVLIATVLYLALFNIPLPMRKDADAIRWSFLFRIHAPNRHPRLAHWLDEPDS